MKKFTTTFFLLFVLSISIFADEGQIPIGGKACPQGTTCRPAEPVENPVIKDIFDFIVSIFG
ncbi:MAG: hypothetical protein WA584_22690 [Pyrinomonadaceae bacterium]